jgi:hypothetical protein
VTPRTRDAVHAALDAVRAERLTRSMLCAIEQRGCYRAAPGEGVESALRQATGRRESVSGVMQELIRRNGAIDLVAILDRIALESLTRSETIAPHAVRDRVASIVAQLDHAAARVRAEFELEPA